tara:strand:+ start:461 stop:1141 length:681 start_codon:yes stop_codon:yes gene_type:complete
MTRNDQQMYSNISSIAKSLEKIANTLDNNVPQTTKDIPGFEGILGVHALNVLSDIKTITDDYASKHKTDDENFPTADYDFGEDLSARVILNDSDYDIRIAAKMYKNLLWNGGSENGKKLHTKKDCILDYVTDEFSVFGARYTDIIKFAYYLNNHNGPKFTNANRGYYSCAFSPRLNGHLIQGGKDQLVKGINFDGNERYFALSYVDQATGYYKRIGIDSLMTNKIR